MSAPGTTHLPSQGRQLGTAAPFFPRLHELAADTAQDGRIGVVTALPDGGRNTFRLASPIGGDQEWSAPADGTTLRPVPAKPTCATLVEPLGAVYDARAGQGSVRVLIHFEDGTQDEAVLILTPADMERLYAQTGRMLGDRDQHWAKT